MGLQFVKRRQAAALQVLLPPPEALLEILRGEENAAGRFGIPSGIELKVYWNNFTATSRGASPTGIIVNKPGLSVLMR
jgi:hypothetical protein